jgi:uncharacterized protein (TIGR03435 family)
MTFILSVSGMVVDHLWQSTVFMGLAALLTLALKSNRAAIRHWVWMAASIKFLVPFALLVDVGSRVQWRNAPQPSSHPLTVALDVVSQPFSQSASYVAPQLPASSVFMSIGSVVSGVLLAVWLSGAAAVFLTWCVRWRRVAAVVRAAHPALEGIELETLRRLERTNGIERPMALVLSDAPLEPGVFGILRPVLVWPRQISRYLTNQQLEAILAHEVSHVRRRDNLAAMLHMLVEGLFWCHPFVWWLGARLVDERERACDEEVLRLGSEPRVYAESILKTCECFVESPLICVAGVTGSDLRNRVERIMRERAGQALSLWRKLLLLACGAVALAGPVLVGIAVAPPLRAESTQAAAPDRLSFEFASIKPNNSGSRRILMQNRPGGTWDATNVTLGMLIRFAFPVQDFQVVGAPRWMYSDRFDVLAKGPRPTADGSFLNRFALMLQSLLVDRFKLTTHTENRELPVYALVMARRDGKMGPQLRPSDVDCATLMARGIGAPAPPPPPLPPPPQRPPEPRERPRCGLMGGMGRISAGSVTMSQLALTLSQRVGRIVVDRTGLSGAFDLDLHFAPQPAVGDRSDLPPAPLAVTNRAANPDEPSLFTALQEQLGLELDSERAPVEVLVIDHVEQPTPD